MLTTTLIVDQPLSVDARLKQLGLTVDLLLEAVRFGEVNRRTCTENDPHYLSGILGTARTVRGLREGLCLLGWGRTDDDNFARTVSPDGTMAIVVATGDEGTGNGKAAVKTKHPRGPNTFEAVNENTLWLFDEAEVPAPRVPKTSDATCMTWVLLIASLPREIRYELSLPAQMSAERTRIEDWKERIIPPPIQRDPEPQVEHGPGPDLGPEINVEVKRRAR